jgi:hypothetical protein
MEIKQELELEFQTLINKMNDEGFELITPVQQKGSLFQINLQLVPMSAPAYKEYKAKKEAQLQETSESSPE